jgi:hypothetical protein
MRPVATLVLSTLLTLPPRLTAQSHGAHAHSTAPEDSAFRAMQARGQDVMGVDQYTSVHRFEAVADGGRIVLQRDRDDSVGVATIRAHLRSIARAFSAGDFTAPAIVHVDAVPGVATMRARRAAIHYAVTNLPRGAALRLRSTEPEAISAIHRFLAYQRKAHRTEAGAPHH